MWKLKASSYTVTYLHLQCIYLERGKFLCLEGRTERQKKWREYVIYQKRIGFVNESLKKVASKFETSSSRATSVRRLRVLKTRKFWLFIENLLFSWTHSAWRFFSICGDQLRRNSNYLIKISRHQRYTSKYPFRYRCDE